MTLLKNDGTLPEKIHQIEIVSWPDEAKLTVRSGWNFGIGFGLAMIIAIPLILILLACIIGIGLTFVGGSLTALLGG